MSKIYDELQEAQKARNDLMKWKLVVVALIGAAGLGLSKAASDNRNFVLILVVIPWACVYIDLLCRNLSLRTKQINHFLAKEIDNLADPELYHKYQKFYNAFRPPRKTSLETYALFWSTLILTVCSSAVGWVLSTNSTGHIFWISGTICLFLSMFFERHYQNEKKKLAHYNG